MAKTLATTTPETPEETLPQKDNKPDAAEKKDPRVKIRILVTGTPVGGGIAAKGAVLKVPKQDADILKENGLAQIIGTA